MQGVKIGLVASLIAAISGVRAAFALPPDAVTDLSASTSTSGGQITLNWTSPANIDSAANPSYDIRYSTTGAVTDTNFSTATQVVNEPTPFNPGTTESMNLTGLIPDLTYYFALKSSNDDGTSLIDENILLGEPFAIAPPFWMAWDSAGDYTQSIAWGDYDNDGYLDLAVGIVDQANQVYRNNKDGTLSSVWSSTNETDRTYSVAWGDYDNDGDLDLAVGNINNQVNRVYRNDGSNTFTLAWNSTETEETYSVAWGDYDNDGDLDLAVGNGNTDPNRVYRNDGGDIFTIVWTSTEKDDTQSIAWGDYDNDGDLDLAVGNVGLAGQANQVYRNDGGDTFKTAWTSTEAATTNSVAWGDYDNDGDLDLAVGDGYNNGRIYRNDREDTFIMAWDSPEPEGTVSVAWGDYDNDGDLDLAVGNHGAVLPGQKNQVYRNDRNDTFTMVWNSIEIEETHSVAWGDYDNDGDLDLAVGNDNLQSNRVYAGEWSQIEVNGAPAAPTLFDASYVDGSLHLKWGDGSDAESTDPDALYYSVRVATNTMASLVANEEPNPSITSGIHGSPLLGRYLRPRTTDPTLPHRAIVGNANTLTLGTTYYWQVRTIDTGLKASPWSEERQILIPASAAGSIFPKEKGGADDTADLINDIQSDDATAPPTFSVVGGDDWYTVDRAKTLYMISFDTTVVSAMGLTAAIFEVQYSVEPGYNGTNQVEVSTNNGTTWIQTGIKPVDGEVDKVASFDLLSYGVDTLDEVAQLDVRFVSNDTGQADAVSFDYIFIRVSDQDTSPPETITDLSAVTGANPGEIDLSWSTPGDDGMSGILPTGSKYHIQYTSIAAQAGDPLYWSFALAQVVISTNGVAPGVSVSTTVGGLENATTYYFRIWTRDEVPNWSDISNMASAQAMQPGPSNVQISQVFVSSIAMTWTSVSSEQGYLVEASTASDFTGTLHSSQTADGGATTLSVLDPALAPNTTYYLRVGSLWNNGATTYAQTQSTSTLAKLVTGAQVYAVFETSVTINWVALGTGQAEGYVLEASTDSNFNPIKASTKTTNVALSTLTVQELSTATTYYFRVGSLNWNDAPNYTGTTPASTSTLAEAPGALAPSNISSTSIQANWKVGLNPPGTEYEVQISSTGFPLVLDSSVTTNSSYTFGSLSSNSMYDFRVRAINHNHVATLFTTLPSTVTLPMAPPSNVKFTKVHISSASLSWKLDSPASERPLEVLAKDAGFTSIVSSATGPIGQETTTYFSLSPNTTYYFKVKVSTASDASYSAPISTITLAATPGSFTPTFSDVFSTSFTVHWGSGTFEVGFNPPGTQYEIQSSTISNFPAIFASFKTTYSSAPFSGLTAGSTYYFRVRAINHNSIPSPFTNLGSTATALFHQDQTIVVTGDNGKISMVIAANALPEDFSIQFNTNPIVEPQGSPFLPSRINEANQKLLIYQDDERRNPLPGKTIEILATNASGEILGETIQAPITLSLSYEEENGLIKNVSPPIREKTLAIYYLNEENNLWVKLPTSQIDQVNNEITANLPHLSVFALIGKTDTSLEDTFAYPVPFKPSLGHQKITFTNLAQVATIRIFTVSGRLVQTLYETDGDGQLDWDVRNSKGSSVVSGVYFYLIESATHKKTGKLMVIR